MLLANQRVGFHKYMRAVPMQRPVGQSDSSPTTDIVQQRVMRLPLTSLDAARVALGLLEFRPGASPVPAKPGRMPATPARDAYRHPSTRTYMVL